MTEYENNAQNNANTLEPEEQVLKLADIWSMIWGNRWWYVISVGFCFFIAILYFLKTPSTYSRSEKIILDDFSQQRTMSDLTQFTGSSAIRLSSSAVYNEIEAFTSPDLMKQVVERLGLETSYIEDRFMRKRELYTYLPFEVVLAGNNSASSFDFIVQKKGDGFKLTDFVIGKSEIKEKAVTLHSLIFGSYSRVVPNRKIIAIL